MRTGFIMGTTRRNVRWARYHDLATAPRVPRATISYPSSLEDVIELCRGTDPEIGRAKLRAAGSHWALSEAALSDEVFVETHDPRERHSAMGATLYDVVPDCLTDDFFGLVLHRRPPTFSTTRAVENAGMYPFHFEAGKRVYQAYAELDCGDAGNPRSLANLLASHGNRSYQGPWAFATLGGAGGQTVFGALTTGTHGGDFRFPPIADCVLAMHLVGDGGKHWWVERESLVDGVRMTRDDKLHDRYGGAAGGPPEDFDVIRDDDFFNALLVSAGRFGVVYSLVIAAVRQYTLHQRRQFERPHEEPDVTTWQAVRQDVANQDSELFNQAGPANAGHQRFTQLVVCVTPFENSTLNAAAVTRRWNVPRANRLNTTVPVGRTERRGSPRAIDPLIQAVRFTSAGNTNAFTPDPENPWQGADPSFLELACAEPDAVKAAIALVAEEVREFVEDNTLVIGGALAAVALVAPPATLLLLIAALAILLALVLDFLRDLDQKADRVGEAFDELRKLLLERDDPAEHEAGMLCWQAIAFAVFRLQQGDHVPYSAISYAMMDGHNYRDKGCLHNGDSLEVFFDATDPNLLAYIDLVLAFEIEQERAGRAFVGYCSLRFTGRTQALIGPEKWVRTCVVEISCLADVAGSRELVAYAEQLARNPNFDCVLHWGQRNEATERDVERWYGDTPLIPGGNFGRWRDALSRVTDNGRLNGFSTQFTRQAGLEVVQPRVGNATLTPHQAQRGEMFTVTWDCVSNPPATAVTVTVETPDGAVTTPVRPADRDALGGSRVIAAAVEGVYRITVEAALTTPTGNRRIDQEVLVGMVTP